MGWMSPGTCMPTVNTPEPERKKHIDCLKLFRIHNVVGHFSAVIESMHGYLCRVTCGHQEPTYFVDVQRTWEKK